MSNIVKMTITKTHKIIIIFAVYCILAYLLMHVIVQHTIDENVTKDDSLINSILKSMYYAVVGIAGYLTLVNLTSIAALFIARKQKDVLAIKAFKITTSITIISTVLFFLGCQLGML
jgi:hypothetical protein